MTGLVIRVVLPRGFGFILGDDGQEYFLHHSNLAKGEIWEGQWWHDGVRVEFEVQTAKDGRLRAVGVKRC